MRRLKIAMLHCLGSNPNKHATQKFHFTHCAQATAALADWVYPAGPNLLEPQVVYNLLKNDMGCTSEEVEAFGFEEPRCWFRFTDNRYVGLEASMAHLAEVCRRERPDGIAGYSNGGGAALLVAAAREAGDEAFQSIRFLMSFAGPTSQMMQRHIRDYLGRHKSRITIPTISSARGTIRCSPALTRCRGIFSNTANGPSRTRSGPSQITRCPTERRPTSPSSNFSRNKPNECKLPPGPCAAVDE